MFFWVVFIQFSLLFCQERLYNPRLYVLLMYLIAYKDYSREDGCNPLLLIVKVWAGLGPMVFPFALGGFPRKNYGVWFIFPLHEFIYLLLLVVITYLILNKEMVEKSWCLLEYCEFTLTILDLQNLLFVPKLKLRRVLQETIHFSTWQECI